MPKLFRTEITERLNLRLPILAGGLQWLADAHYVAAAARAGIMGFITAASFEDDQALRREIRECRRLCDGKPFGVNISMLPKGASDSRIESMVNVVADEGVSMVETSGRNPEAYLDRLHASGALVMHKVPGLKYALKAQEIGVDLVAIVGSECGGHPGEAAGTFVQACLAAHQLRIPYLVGGGVGTGAQLVAALAMGADGVLVGTRFLAAEEIGAHPDYKARLVAATESDTTTILSSLRNTMRVLSNETSARIQALERSHAGLDEILPLAAGRIARQAYQDGDFNHGALSVGQAVAFIDRVQPLNAIVDTMEREAREAVSRLARLGSPFTASIGTE